MKIDDISANALELMQHTANDTMTRVILIEVEKATGNLESSRVLIVEPLKLEITTGDDRLITQIMEKMKNA